MSHELGQSGQPNQSTESTPHVATCLIIDFGSQYGHLIARRVRELGVYCELIPHQEATHVLSERQPSALILSGGGASVHDLGAPKIPAIVWEMSCPILSICYGMQQMVQQWGGVVRRARSREFGDTRVEVLEPGLLLVNMADGHTEAGRCLLDVWMSHGDDVEALGDAFSCMAKSERGIVAAVAHREKPWYGLQFHPEVTHTKHGLRILERFLYDICECRGDWEPANMLACASARIKERVGDDGVLLGLSGGVDSAVVAALLHRLLGDQLTCVFVDHGLLRLDEAAQVMRFLTNHFSVQIMHVDAKERFYRALEGVSDPEQKRKIIGRLFIEIFEETAESFDNLHWLAQGTIYPDVIESAGKTAGGNPHVIKSHHNVGGLPERLALTLLEPLRMLFKDEVRQLGEQLGLPPVMVWRHPFPGPGLAVRIVGAVTPERVLLLQKADAIFIALLRESGWYEKTSQAFAVLLPVNSVGVLGDARYVGPVIALRAVLTHDFMTAEWAQLPHELLASAASRIVNEVSGISRVVYDITNKPPATIEWE